jgi:hypothetical protein
MRASAEPAIATLRLLSIAAHSLGYAVQYRYVMVCGTVRQTWHPTSINSKQVILSSLVDALDGRVKIRIFFFLGFTTAINLQKRKKIN